MGGSLINDCLTNNFLENESKIKIIFVSKQKSSEKYNNCYIDEKFKPINMPFNAIFCEDERIKKIDKDFNTKQIENYFGLDINTFVKLVLNKQREIFNSNLFFQAFNLNKNIYKKENLTNFNNCKKINDKFELIESTNELDKFFIKTEILFSKLKVYFTFNKLENKLNIDVFQLKKDEEVFYDKYKFTGENCILKNVFEKLYKKNIPIFLSENQLNKIKEIENIYPMIFSNNIEDFVNKNQEINKINDLTNERLENFISLILNDINEKKCNYIEILRYLFKSKLSNLFHDNELFKNIYFENLEENINNLIFYNSSKNEIITKEDILKIFDKESLLNNLTNFIALNNIMKQLNLEYKTYSLVGYPDKNFEVSWRDYCKLESEKKLEINELNF